MVLIWPPSCGARQKTSTRWLVLWHQLDWSSDLHVCQLLKKKKKKTELKSHSISVFFMDYNHALKKEERKPVHLEEISNKFQALKPQKFKDRMNMHPKDGDRLLNVDMLILMPCIAWEKEVTDDVTNLNTTTTSVSYVVNCMWMECQVPGPCKHYYILWDCGNSYSEMKDKSSKVSCSLGRKEVGYNWERGSTTHEYISQ